MDAYTPTSSTHHEFLNHTHASSQAPPPFSLPTRISVTRALFVHALCSFLVAPWATHGRACRYRRFRKPLIIPATKSLLRHRLAVSDLADFGPEKRFTRVYDEAFPEEIKGNENIRKVLCPTLWGSFPR